MKNKPKTAGPVVTAPIVLDAAKDSVKGLLDFIRGLESHDNIAAATRENERLTPYFTALSGYLRKALARNASSSTDREFDALDKLTQPSGLAGLFNAAARTGNTIISHVAILSDEVTAKGPAARLFNKPRFNIGYSHNGHKFNFGFLQVYEGARAANAKSSTTFPVFILDAEMMKAVAPHKPLKMLGDFQEVISTVNHDMLHHLTNPVITPVVSKKFRFEEIVSEDGQPRPLDVWYNGLVPNMKSSVYESWSQMAHEKAVLAPENAPELEKTKAAITRYFSELERIGREIAKKKDADRAHDVVDYFGMVMAHALSRVFPLNHPMMAQCMELMQKADPAPQKCLEDAAVMTEPTAAKQKKLRALFRGKGQPPTPREISGKLQSFVHYQSKWGDVVRDYRSGGLELLPGGENATSYRTIKLLQLINCSPDDVRPHVPGPMGDHMMHLRMEAGRSMLSMIKAAAKSFDYTAK